MKEPSGDNGRSWEASPCSSCRSSPCCTRLPVHRFRIENRRGLDWAASVLDHPRLELGLYDSGWWMAYYLAPCRFLNPLDSKCLVHASPRQPEICRDYSPVRCWYKRVFAPQPSPPVSENVRPPAGPATARRTLYLPAGVARPEPAPTDFIRFDRRRLAELAEMIAFDDAGELSSVPDWELLHLRMSALPLVDATAAGYPVDQVAPAPQTPVEPAAAPPSTAPPSRRQQPATAGFIFPARTPRTRRDLDLVRFRLGFPGVRAGVNGEEWVTVIGAPPEAARYVVVSYGGLEPLLASFTFAEDGRIVDAPRLVPALRRDVAPTATAVDEMPSAAQQPAPGGQ